MPPKQVALYMDEETLSAVPELVNQGPSGARQLAERLVKAVQDHHQGSRCQIQPYLIIGKLGARQRWQKLLDDRDADAEQARGRLLSKFIKTLQLDADVLVIDSHSAKESATEDLWQRVQEVDADTNIFLASVSSPVSQYKLDERPIFQIDVGNTDDKFRVRPWLHGLNTSAPTREIVADLQTPKSTTTAQRKRSVSATTAMADAASATEPLPSAAPLRVKRSRISTPEVEPMRLANVVDRPTSPLGHATSEEHQEYPYASGSWRSASSGSRSSGARTTSLPPPPPPPPPPVDRKAKQQRRAIEDKMLEFLVSTSGHWDKSIYEYVRAKTENAFWSLDRQEFDALLEDLRRDRLIYVYHSKQPHASLPGNAKYWGLTQQGLDECRQLREADLIKPWNYPAASSASSASLLKSRHGVAATSTMPRSKSLAARIGPASSANAIRLGAETHFSSARAPPPSPFAILNPANPSSHLDNEINTIIKLFARCRTGQWDTWLYQEYLDTYPDTTPAGFGHLISRCEDLFILKDATDESRRKGSIPPGARFLKLRKRGMERLREWQMGS